MREWTWFKRHSLSKYFIIFTFSPPPPPRKLDPSDRGGGGILEYCAEGINPTSREQYYFDLLKPEYNILKQANSLLGFKHSESTLEFFNNERKVSLETRQNLSLAATGRILSEETRKKISEARKDIKLTDETRSLISQAAIALRGVKVTVKNLETSEILEYTSLTEAAKALGVSRPAVKKSLDTKRPLRSKYMITLQSCN